MGFLQEVISVLPSIATVIAPLFNAKKGDYLKFSLHKEQSVYFEKDENGGIVCFNPFHEPISLTFPNQNGIGGETIKIGESDHFLVTTALTDRAGACIDSFQIERGGVTVEQNVANARNTSVTATISASGKIPNRNESTKIGPSLFAKVEGNDLYVQVIPPYNLEGILSLEISGDGNQPCRLFKNVQNDGSTPSPVMKDAVSPAEIKFPGALCTLKDSNNLFVSITARCSYNSNKLPDDAIYRGVHTTESDWEFLKTGRCLNE